MPPRVHAFPQVTFFDAGEGAVDLERSEGENAADCDLSHLWRFSQHRLCAAQKNVEALPALEQTLVPCAWDEVVVDELWTFVVSKVQQAWVWLVLSRHSLQVVAFWVGARDLHSARALWAQVPSPWSDGLVFTDGYRVYESLFQDQPLKHCRCLKSDQESWGQTSIVEGANNALRQGVSYLGRKSLAFARSWHWLHYRLHWFIHHWNLRQAKKWG
jgi:IS1 family transposase